MLRPGPFAGAPPSWWFRWGPVAALGVVVLALLLWVTRPGGVGIEKLEPVQVSVSARDPLLLAVAVRWPYDGLCSGEEVHPVVREQRDRVVVRRVERHTGSSCAGVGVEPGSLVYGTVHLQQPLGRRLVVTGDGRTLPVVPADF